MDAARKAGMPVIVVQQTAPASSQLREHYLRKLLPGAYPEINHAQWLQARTIDRLTVVGYMAHNCVASTINHALHNGTAAEFLHDASGAVPYSNQAGAASAEEIHRVFCGVLQSRFAAVMSAQEWGRSVETGAVPVRDSIYMSNQRARVLLQDATC